jgi:xanthine dehydrogenase accessory factor
VKKDQKIADIHPTMGQEECFTISDKARCVAGSVLEAVMVWEHKRPKRRFFGRG